MGSNSTNRLADNLYKSSEGLEYQRQFPSLHHQHKASSIYSLAHSHSSIIQHRPQILLHLYKMVATKLALGAVMAALATTGSAGSLKIKNHCSATTNIRIAHANKCEFGQGGQTKCINKGAKPYQIKTGKSISFSWIGDGQGASVKMYKDAFNKVLQFEYALTKTGAYKGLYWDLSDIDGAGPDHAGTPWRKDNVHIKPSGNGAGSGTCEPLKCKANEICRDSYQRPADKKTRYCPVNTGDMWIALCQPNSQFNARAEAAEDDMEIVDLGYLEEELPADATTPAAMPQIILDYFLQQAAQPTSPAVAEEPAVTKFGRAYYA
ncbi:hypothetical protein MN608_10790 [Microdochium nivale]|nr:hypothetical protein MN608_10790 [Microdochium nivale]